MKVLRANYFADHFKVLKRLPLSELSMSITYRLSKTVLIFFLNTTLNIVSQVPSREAVCAGQSEISLWRHTVKVRCISFPFLTCLNPHGKFFFVEKPAGKAVFWPHNCIPQQRQSMLNVFPTASRRLRLPLQPRMHSAPFLLHAQVHYR